MTTNVTEILSPISGDNGSDFLSEIAATATTAVSTVSLGITTYELWIQLIFFYLIMAAIVGTTLNVYVAICIIKCKKVHSRFYVIASIWMLTRATVGFQYIFISTYRILRTLGLVSVLQLRITCHTLHVTLYFTGISEIYLLVVMVVDRIIAVGKPTFYRLLTIRQAVIVAVAVEVANVFVNLIPSYVGVDLMEVIECLNVLSPLEGIYEQYHEQEPLVLTGLLFALQLVAIGLTWLKVREMKRQSGESEQAVFLKRQVALMTALRNMVFGHAGLTVLSRVLVFLAGLIPSQSARFIAYSGIVQTIDIFTGPVILILSKKELRRACTPYCRVGVDFDESRLFGSSQQKNNNSQTNGVTAVTFPN